MLLLLLPDVAILAPMRALYACICVSGELITVHAQNKENRRTPLNITQQQQQQKTALYNARKMGKMQYKCYAGYNRCIDHQTPDPSRTVSIVDESISFISHSQCVAISTELFSE